ncbi:MAG: hypothetical protein HY747_07500 [Elusimicrobia bacterium]|nr:hypothetical protein [Elusimicrobiota bacterium]
MSAENMRKLGLQLQEALKRRRDHLVLDLAKLSNLDEESAKELVLGLGGYLQRVRLVAPLTFIYPRVADWLAHFRPYC